MATAQNNDHDQYNLEEAWAKACTSFAKTTNIDLTLPQEYTVDEVLEQIRDKQDEEDKHNNKYRKAKDVISKTLKCVTVLGGIAAEGASMVFPPTSLCFNAIKHLINTGAQYKRIFSSLTELFQRISDVLERCKIYLRLPPHAVDIALRRIISEELVCFIDICALSIKVLDTPRIWTAVKVFAFDSDAGVNEQLDRLASLVERESQTRATLGYESQKTTERGVMENREGNRKINATVDKLLHFQKKKDAESATKRLLKSIDSRLAFPSNTFKTTKASYKNFLNDQVQGTGQWLQKDPLFEEWVSLERGPLSILGISGGEGYGKTFLFASMIQDLLEVHSPPRDDLTCVSIAYHIFQEEKKRTSLVQALKSLSWQVANRDVVYRKDVGSVQTYGVNEISDLWNILFAKSYKSDSSFFLLLDGVDQIDKLELGQFIRLLNNLQQTTTFSWPFFRLRLVLSGRDETMNEIRNSMMNGLSVINVGLKNGNDMEKYINDRMNRMEIFSGQSDQVNSLRLEIVKNLTTHSKGDFVKVGLLLHEISRKQRPGEIRDILSRSDGNRSDTIVRKMEHLNKTLSGDDISDLNILLTWVVFSIRNLTLEELEAVLTLKTGEPSLRPLTEKIKDKYSSLLIIKGKPHPITNIFPPTSQVTLVSESIERLLLSKSEPEFIEDPNQIDLTGDVSEGEVRIVRHFLKSVCEPSLFSKFGFDEFFQRKIEGKTPQIGVDADTAHLSILSTCLDALCSQGLSGIDAIIHYASVYFPEHLERADPSLTQPQQKTAIGPQLVSLFTDQKKIERWWNQNTSWPRFDWIYNDRYAEFALKWLQDSAVTKRLSPEELKWVKSLSSKSEPNADIIENIARYLAHLWLQSGPWDAAESFAAVHGYITKIANRKNPGIKRSTTDPAPVDIDASQIMDAAEWARQQLGLEAFGYDENCNLACTLSSYAKHEEAIQHFKIASSQEEYNWFSQWGLAACYANQQEYTLAIETVEDAINTLRWGNGIEELDYLPGISRDLARWCGDAGDTRKAFDTCEEVLTENPGDYDTALDMILLFHRDKNYEGLFSFLESLNSSTDQIIRIDRRTATFYAHYDNEDLHSALFALASIDEKHFNFVSQSYEMAIIAAQERFEEAREKREAEEILLGDRLAALIHNFAHLCYENDNDNSSRREFAIEQWVYVLHIEEISEESESYLAFTKAHVRSKLASVYFREACRDSATAFTYLEKLEGLAASNLTDGQDLGRSGTYPSELVAWYHALHGNERKSIDALRTQVKRSIDILSDDDPLNDWQGYRGLARYFMCAGQDADCLAAWSLIVPYDNVEPQSDLPQASLSTALRGPMSDMCDGGCHTIWEFANDFYVCRECDYMEFDPECLKKLREGILKDRICGQNHQMLHVPAYDRALWQKIGKGNVMVGEEVISVRDWLQRIKGKWGIRA